jgi:hypothetical protein
MKNVLIALAGLAAASAALAQVDPTRVMITGIGNTNAKPGDFVVTNQTESSSSSTSDTTTLEKFVVTGSLLGHERKTLTAPSGDKKVLTSLASKSPVRGLPSSAQAAAPRP